MPASSSSLANLRLFSHEFTQRSGILVTDMPLLQLLANVPSRNCPSVNMEFSAIFIFFLFELKLEYV